MSGAGLPSISNSSSGLYERSHAFDDREVGRVRLEVAGGHLVRAERAFDLLAVDLLRSGPALRRPQHDHRPRRLQLRGARAGLALDPADQLPGLVERRGHPGVDAVVVTRDHERGPAESAVEREQLVVAHRPGDRRGADLVAVDVEDREDGTAGPRVEEAVAVPGRGRRPGLGLAVADDARHEQVRVVHRRPERGRQRIAELAAFVDRARRTGRQVAREAARPRERADEPLDARRVARHVRIELLERPVEVVVGEVRRGAVARTRHQQDSSLAFVHEPVEVGVDEVDRGRRAPVPEQTRLDVVGAEWLAQQRVRLQVDLGGREEVRRAPVAADDRERVAGLERLAGSRGAAGGGRLDGRGGHRGVSWRSRRARVPRFTLAHPAVAVTVPRPGSNGCQCEGWCRDDEPA